MCVKTMLLRGIDKGTLIGSTIYWVHDDPEMAKSLGPIIDGVIHSFSVDERNVWWIYVRYKCGLTYYHVAKKDVGNVLFFTFDEAIKALDKLKQGG